MKIKAGIFFLFIFLNCNAQDVAFPVLFYNVENLFDTRNDSLTLDDEFTPEGKRRWIYKRFSEKIQKLSKTLIYASGWNEPAVIGVCEVENRFVLERLLKNTPLKVYPLKIIHKDSPDKRGIDVAMLYNSNLFYPITYEYYPILNADSTPRDTREILYVAGIMGESTDTLHFFVNHWPSRYSGLLETQGWRNKAAVLLREKVELLFRKDKKAKIVIMGDFNDQPVAESICDYLKAQKIATEPIAEELYNLSVSWETSGRGTLKYRSQWFVFDQIIVSGALLAGTNGVYTRPEWADVVSGDFLFEADERYGGLRPRRTYNGFRYHGGFSDHLPVRLLLKTGAEEKRK